MSLPTVNAAAADSTSASVSAAAYDQFGQELLLPDTPPLLPAPAPLPFFNVMIPLADNFGGPVNVSVSPSVDPSGADLPISGNNLIQIASHHVLHRRCCLLIIITYL